MTRKGEGPNLFVCLFVLRREDAQFPQNSQGSGAIFLPHHLTFEEVYPTGNGYTLGQHIKAMQN